MQFEVAVTGYISVQLVKERRRISISIVSVGKFLTTTLHRLGKRPSTVAGTTALGSVWSTPWISVSSFSWQFKVFDKSGDENKQFVFTCLRV